MDVYKYKVALAYYESAPELTEFMESSTNVLKHAPMKRKWDELGPLSIDEIVKNTEAKLVFDPYHSKLEFRKEQFDGYVIEGQFRFGTKVPHGIGKQIM